MEGDLLYCRTCGAAPKADASKRRWLASGCPGPRTRLRALALNGARIVPRHCPVILGMRALHPTHTLVCFKGLYICTTCAHYAAHQVRGLGEVCPGFSTPYGMSLINRFHKGLPPYGLSVWPDGSQSEEEQVILLEPVPTTTSTVIRAVSDRILARINARDVMEVNFEDAHAVDRFEAWLRTHQP